MRGLNLHHDENEDEVGTEEIAQNELLAQLELVRKEDEQFGWGEEEDSSLDKSDAEDGPPPSPETEQEAILEAEKRKKMEEDASLLHLLCWTNAPVEEVESLLFSNPDLLGQSNLPVAVSTLSSNKSPLDIVRERSMYCMCGCCNLNRRRVMAALDRDADYYKLKTVVDEDERSSQVSKGISSTLVTVEDDQPWKNGLARVHCGEQNISWRTSATTCASTGNCDNDGCVEEKRTSEPRPQSQLGHNESDTASSPTHALTENVLAERDRLEAELLHKRESLWMVYGNSIRSLELELLELRKEESNMSKKLDEKNKQISVLRDTLQNLDVTLKSSKSRTSKKFFGRKRDFNRDGQRCKLVYDIGMAIVDRASVEKEMMSLLKDLKRTQRMYRTMREHIFGGVDRQLERILGTSDVRNCALSNDQAQGACLRDYTKEPSPSQDNFKPVETLAKT